MQGGVMSNPIQEISKLRRASKKAQAIFLTDLEIVLAEYPEVQGTVRKIFLDCINNLTRELAKSYVGSIEDLVR